MTRRVIFWVAATAVATAFVLLVIRPDPPERADPIVANSDPTVPAEPADPADRTDPDLAGGADEPAAASGTSVTTSAANVRDADDHALRVEPSWVLDGDSLEVEWLDPPPESVWRDQVRLLGINAPEGDACFGPEARDQLRSLVGDAPLLVEVVESERDDFGRAIANVWTGDGVLLNLAMVEVGAALSLSDGGEFGADIAAAEDRARHSALGLWSACGAAAAAEVVIVDLRHDARGPDHENANDEWIQVANLGSEPVDLSGWGIRDESTRHRFEFPGGFVLDPGGGVRVHSGCGDDGFDALFWCASDPVWNNGGDTGYLTDPNGHFVDRWSYSG